MHDGRRSAIEPHRLSMVGIAPSGERHRPVARQSIADVSMPFIVHQSRSSIIDALRSPIFDRRSSIY
jgi:small ligand-binding sensory domain FIST